MPSLPSRILAIAERRLGSIDAYYGPVQPLIDGYRDGQFFAQRIRTLSQTKGDEITVILALLHQIKNTVTVVHGARGCAAMQNYLESYDGHGAPVFSTNLTEDNSIMGAEEVLRKTILAAVERHNPEAVFVVTTPIVAINNDDVQTVAADLGEKLKIPVVPIYADGFKSKTSANGYDIAYHSLAGYLVAEKRATDKKLVNIILSDGSEEDMYKIAELISSIGLNPNIFPRFGSLSAIRNSANAAATIGLKPDSRVMGEFLERERQVPYYLFEQPVGPGGTLRWLEAILEKTGNKSEPLEFIKSREKKKADELAANSETNLNGKRVYISGDIHTAVALAGLVKEFGGSISGLSLANIDKNSVALLDETYKKNGWAFNIHIGDGQVFEQANILTREKPDVYLGATGQAVHAARLGIPSVNYSPLPLYGYDSAVNLIRAINRTWNNRSFVEKLGSYASVYSRSSWFGKNPNWYIKQEVG
jgi:nitrogenase molybdenum-iron protein alpha/beta subunit